MRLADDCQSGFLLGSVSVRVKAGEAEDGTMPFWLKRHSGSMTAGRARCIGDGSRVAAASFNARN